MQVRVETTTTLVYGIDELSDSAKEKAREWYREGNLDYEWWDCVYEEAKTVGELMGITVEDIYFSGFWRQGDGAMFVGTYGYEKGGAKAVRSYAPQDEELHRIAAGLQEVQRRNFYGLSAVVRSQGRPLSYSDEITVYDKEGYHADVAVAEEVITLLRDFMVWIYRALEAECEYLNSDECVDEGLRANEYTFTEEGECA